MDNNLILKALKISREEFHRKYRSVTYSCTGHGSFVTVKASLHRKDSLKSDKFSFAIAPEKFAGGLSKKVKVLMGVKAQVVNLETREIESGYFQFYVTVEIPSDGDLKYVYGKLVEGRLMLYHMDTTQLLSVPATTNWIKKYSDYDKAYNKREHVDSKPKTPYVESVLGQEEA